MSHSLGSLFRQLRPLNFLVVAALLMMGNAQAGNLTTPRALGILSLGVAGPHAPIAMEDRAVKTVVDASGNVFVSGVTSNGVASVSTLGLGTLSGVGSATGGVSIYPNNVQRISTIAFSVLNNAASSVSFALGSSHFSLAIGGTATFMGTAFVELGGALALTSSTVALQISTLSSTMNTVVLTGSALVSGGSTVVASTGVLSTVAYSLGMFNVNYFGGSEDYYTAKYSGVDGSLIWSKRFDGGGADHVADMALDPDGNVIVTGSASGNFCTLKYSGLDGTTLWMQQEVAPVLTYSSAYPATAVPVAVAVDPAGNVAVTGYVIGQSFDYYTVKYAKADGSKLWQKQHDGPVDGIDVPSAVAMDAAGNVVVTGYSQGVTLGTTAIGGGVGTIDTIKYATDTGAVLWETIHTEPSTNVSQAKAVIVDSQGNAIITGTVNNGTNFDIYTAKYAAADGSQIWEHRYDGPAALDDVGNAVAVDGADNVVITGYSTNSKDSDAYTAKYAAADGTLIWEQRFDGGHGNDVAQALKVDASGNVTITGYSHNAAGNDDYYTASYAGLDGTLRWSQIYDGPAHGNDQAASVAVDASGNAVVTGFSFNGTDDDFYTAKYAALDGTLLWEQRYNGAVLGNQQALAITHDATGNAIVTGSSRNTAGNLDIYTAKYAVGTGALVWSQTYDGPAHGDDVGNAVAVDASGNVVITGYSYNSSGNKDVYTAKYAAADGTLLWQQIYNGSANTDDFGNAVTVDSAGDVIVVGGSSETANSQPVYYDSNGVLTINGAISGTLAAGTFNLAGSVFSPTTGTLTLSGGEVFTGLTVTSTTSGSLTLSAGFGLSYYGGVTIGTANWQNGDLTKIGSGTLILNNGGANVTFTGGTVTGTVIPPRYIALGSLTTGTGVYTGVYTPTPTAALTAVFVVKYAGATGKPLWENKSTTTTVDSAAAVTTDAANSVYITGTKTLSYYTAKYAADGLPIWEKSYAGLNGLTFNHGRSLAVDSQGNVVVTGTSIGAASATTRAPLQGGANLYNLDYYTAKYAAKDGSLIWEHRYDGPGGFSVDEAYAVAVDPQGNAVVTGYSDSGSGSCFYTAKYASADGSTVWEQRYNDPTGGARLRQGDGHGFHGRRGRDRLFA